MEKKPQILLTNDDGIRSPGLWAAAEALSQIGYVHVVAPRDQFSGAGRSMPITSDGLIEIQAVEINQQSWKVYAVGGSPAQVVGHAILEVLTEPPDLVVAGINYGENLGNGITISGTVGAALEGAALGYPALAVSLETDPGHHLSYSNEVDFSAAAYFTQLFGRLLLEKRFPEDVDALKVDIPSDATPETPWEITRVSRQPYFEPTRPSRQSWDTPELVGYRRVDDLHQDGSDSDIYAVCIKRFVSVSPLSLDLTSRTDLQALEQDIRAALKPQQA
ncbi:MAG TPA: 5'/3'-nucleotidase SurE [Anaerolineales bacterium]|nr:5'/3'-nucleotidase SurE [Anaerolineales bacterium]